MPEENDKIEANGSTAIAIASPAKAEPAASEAESTPTVAEAAQPCADATAEIKAEARPAEAADAVETRSRYDTIAKHKSRLRVLKMIQKHWGEKAKDLSYLCLPGPALFEIEQVCLPAGMDPENITCVGYDQGDSKEFRAELAMKGLNITNIVMPPDEGPFTQDDFDLQHFFETTTERYDVLSIDFTGQLTDKNIGIVASGIKGHLADKGVVHVNFNGSREGNNVKENFGDAMQALRTRIEYLGNSGTGSLVSDPKADMLWKAENDTGGRVKADHDMERVATIISTLIWFSDGAILKGVDGVPPIFSGDWENKQKVARAQFELHTQHSGVQFRPELLESQDHVNHSYDFVRLVDLGFDPLAAEGILNARKMAYFVEKSGHLVKDIKFYKYANPETHGTAMIGCIAVLEKVPKELVRALQSSVAKFSEKLNEIGQLQNKLTIERPIDVTSALVLSAMLTAMEAHPSYAKKLQKLFGNCMRDISAIAALYGANIDKIMRLPNVEKLDESAPKIPQVDKAAMHAQIYALKLKGVSDEEVLKLVPGATRGMIGACKAHITMGNVSADTMQAPDESYFGVEANKMQAMLRSRVPHGGQELMAGAQDKLRSQVRSSLYRAHLDLSYAIERKNPVLTDVLSRRQELILDECTEDEKKAFTEFLESAFSTAESNSGEYFQSLDRLESRAMHALKKRADGEAIESTVTDAFVKLIGALQYNPKLREYLYRAVVGEPTAAAYRLAAYIAMANTTREHRYPPNSELVALAEFFSEVGANEASSYCYAKVQESTIEVVGSTPMDAAYVVSLIEGPVFKTVRAVLGNGASFDDEIRHVERHADDGLVEHIDIVKMLTRKITDPTVRYAAALLFFGRLQGSIMSAYDNSMLIELLTVAEHSKDREPVRMLLDEQCNCQIILKETEKSFRFLQDASEHKDDEEEEDDGAYTLAKSTALKQCLDATRADSGMDQVSAATTFAIVTVTTRGSPAEKDIAKKLGDAIRERFNVYVHNGSFPGMRTWGGETIFVESRDLEKLELFIRREFKSDVPFKLTTGYVHLAVSSYQDPYFGPSIQEARRDGQARARLPPSATDIIEGLKKHYAEELKRARSQSAEGQRQIEADLRARVEELREQLERKNKGSKPLTDEIAELKGRLGRLEKELADKSEAVERLRASRRLQQEVRSPFAATVGDVSSLVACINEVLGESGDEEQLKILVEAGNMEREAFVVESLAKHGISVRPDGIRTLTKPVPWSDTDECKALGPGVADAQETLKYIAESRAVPVLSQTVKAGLDDAQRAAEAAIADYERKKKAYEGVTQAALIVTEAEKIHGDAQRLMKAVETTAKDTQAQVIFSLQGQTGTILAPIAPSATWNRMIDNIVLKAVTDAAAMEGETDSDMERVEPTHREGGVCTYTVTFKPDRATVRSFGKMAKLLRERLKSSPLSALGAEFSVIEIKQRRD